jgi:hypothetical protein
MNPSKQLRDRHIALECQSMKDHCGEDFDNIMIEDWCNIDPKNYVRKGQVNPQQCFDLESLIKAMNAGLRSRRSISDPTTNIDMSNETVIALCARHVYNGNDLPYDLGRYVLALMAAAARVAAAAPVALASFVAQIPEFEAISILYHLSLGEKKVLYFLNELMEVNLNEDAGEEETIDVIRAIQVLIEGDAVVSYELVEILVNDHYDVSEDNEVFIYTLHFMINYLREQ